MTLDYINGQNQQPKQRTFLVLWHPKSKTPHLPVPSYSPPSYLLITDLDHQAWSPRAASTFSIQLAFATLIFVLKLCFLSCSTLWLPACLHFVPLSDIWGFSGWVFGTFTALLAPGTTFTQEALGMSPSNAFSTLYLIYHSEFVTTTQFWVSDIRGPARSIMTSAILRASPRVLEYQHSDWSDHETFPTVERPLTSTLLCVSHPAGLMQTLFPKGVLRIEFRSLSPCWQVIGWWPVHRQEDMPRTELFFMGKTLADCPGYFTFFSLDSSYVSRLSVCIRTPSLCPMSSSEVSYHHLGPHGILDQWREISRKP